MYLDDSILVHQNIHLHLNLLIHHLSLTIIYFYINTIIDGVAYGLSIFGTSVGSFVPNPLNALLTAATNSSWLTLPAAETTTLGATKCYLWNYLIYSSDTFTTFSLIPLAGYPIIWSL